MRPGRLTLSGGSCVAQIIYPSATAPRPTGEPESRPSVYGPAHQWGERADSPAHAQNRLGTLHKCHTQSNSQTLAISQFVHSPPPQTFLSSYVGYKQSGLFRCMSFCVSLYLYLYCWRDNVFSLGLCLTAHVRNACGRGFSKPTDAALLSLWVFISALVVDVVFFQLLSSYLSRANTFHILLWQSLHIA